jgi:hypothetical protein
MQSLADIRMVQGMSSSKLPLPRLPYQRAEWTFEPQARALYAAGTPLQRCCQLRARSRSPDSAERTFLIYQQGSFVEALVAPRRLHGSLRGPSAASEPWCPASATPLMSRADFRPGPGPSGWFGPLRLQVTEVARHGPTEPEPGRCDSGIWGRRTDPRRPAAGPCPRARASRRTESHFKRSCPSSIY